MSRFLQDHITCSHGRHMRTNKGNWGMDRHVCEAKVWKWRRRSLLLDANRGGRRDGTCILQTLAYSFLGYPKDKARKASKDFHDIWLSNIPSFFLCILCDTEPRIFFLPDEHIQLCNQGIKFLKDGAICGDDTNDFFGQRALSPFIFLRSLSKGLRSSAHFRGREQDSILLGG